MGNKQKKEKEIKARRSVIAPVSVTPEHAVVRNGRPLPQTGSEWLLIVAPILFTDHAKFRRRTLDLCEDTATALLAEAGEGAPDAATPAPAAEVDAEEEGAEDVAAAADSPAMRRLEAVYVLVAASRAALKSREPYMLQRAVDLAVRAVQIDRRALTCMSVAFACFHQGSFVQERTNKEELFTLAAHAADTASQELATRDGGINREEQMCLARLCWLQAMLGRLEEAKRYVAVLLKQAPTDYLGLLLLALLHAAEGRHDRAAVALAHMQSHYPTDIPSAIVSAVVKAVSEREPLLSSDGVPQSAAQEDLAVALARLHKMTEEVKGLPAGSDRKRTIKALSIQCVPGEDSEPGMTITGKERSHVVAGHWALLTHAAVRMQAIQVFRPANDGAFQFLNLVPQERRAFADVICSRARMSLLHVKERLPASSSVRDLNLLGVIHPAQGFYTERQPALSLTSAVRGADTSDSTAQAAMLSGREVALLRAQLTKALETYGGHAEAYALLGALYLLDAGQRQMNAEERTERLSEAAHYCTLSARCDLFQREALEGLGVVRELQGATTASVDLFSATAEMATRESLLSFERFSYLFC